VITKSENGKHTNTFLNTIIVMVKVDRRKKKFKYTLVSPFNIAQCVTARFPLDLSYYLFMCVFMCLYVINYLCVYFNGFSVVEGYYGHFSLRDILVIL